MIHSKIDPTIETLRWHLYSKTGELFRASERTIFLPTELINKAPVEIFPKGTILYNTDNRLVNPFIEDGFETINHSIIFYANGEIWVELRTTYEDLLGMEFSNSQFIEWKNMLIRLFFLGNEKASKVPEMSFFSYRIKSEGDNIRELVEVAYAFDKLVNSKIFSMVKRLPDVFRSTLGLPSTEPLINLKLAPFQAKFFESQSLKKGVEVINIQIEKVENSKCRCTVICEYPTSNWNLNIKQEVFLILKKELIMFPALQNPQIQSLNILERTIEYSFILEEPESECLEKAITINAHLNFQLLVESLKSGDYISEMIKNEKIVPVVGPNGIPLKLKLNESLTNKTRSTL